jgi:predicted MFS family arabinose efflux permease
LGAAQALGQLATAITASIAGPIFAFLGPAAPNLFGALALVVCAAAAFLLIPRHERRATAA